jgi:hypothetical protein
LSPQEILYSQTGPAVAVRGGIEKEDEREDENEDE